MKGTPLGTTLARRAGVGAAAVAVALAAGTGQASANKYEVTKTDESGKGTFAAAVKKANKHDGGDQISFKKSLRGEIVLPGDVTLKGKVVIKGNGYGEPDDKKFRRVELVGRRGASTFLVGQDTNVALRSLYLDGINVRGSRQQKLTVKESYLRGDRTVDTTGIDSAGEALRVLQTTVKGYDQGIRTSSDARIDKSTIADNVGGGGIEVHGGEVDVTASTISGNIVQGGPLAFGGGIAESGYGSAVRVTNATIVGNQAIGAGGAGGGLFGNVDVNNSTIANNRAATGAGVAGRSGGDADVSNSILYGNHMFDGSSSDCGNPFTSGGGNVIGSPGECLLTGDDRAGVDPLLGALADNGGPTETMAIGAGSPAIGLALKATATEFDQRHVARGNDPDAGAFELEG
jgi:hypothetical protein